MTTLYLQDPREVQSTNLAIDTALAALMITAVAQVMAWTR